MSSNSASRHCNQENTTTFAFTKVNTLDRKRRHPNTTDETATTRPLTSLEILERVENPNFQELARQYPAFRQAWEATRTRQKEKGPHTTFSSCVTQEFTIALTRALLQTYFHLKLPYLEVDHLCPPIPNRFFYLHWIHSQLLENISTNNVRSFGLDIGTGASCIYPLLAARFYRSRMITTEIDKKASEIARSNVQANQLSNYITVLDVLPSFHQLIAEGQQPNHSHATAFDNGGPLQRAIEEIAVATGLTTTTTTTSPVARPALDFVMTNPPFYDPNTMEYSTARVGDGRARTNMTVSEGTYPGGEVGFVLDMVEDSLRCTNTTTTTAVAAVAATHLLTPSTWFSTMLGKKTSLVKLQKILVHLLGPAHVQVTEYGPGQYTRWFLAWTLAQPVGIEPNAQCSPHDKDMFKVSLETLMKQEPRVCNAAVAMNEIVERIVKFCETTPGGWNLMAQLVPNKYDDEGDDLVTVHIQEAMPLAISNFVDETQDEIEMPTGIRNALRGRANNNNFLPPEGHFLVQVKIRHVARQDGDLFKMQLFLFRHSARGGKAIEKIRTSIEGEVCRTNRKWRKIREREGNNLHQ
jgi:23S rRNA A1618 N6-methylase RlmF